MNEGAILTEEEVYSLIVTGELPKPAAMNVIRSYGNRKAMDALEQARRSIPDPPPSIAEAEIDMRFASCLESLGRILRASAEGARKDAG